MQSRGETMNNTNQENLKLFSKKPVLSIGDKTVCILDKKIVEELGITEGLQLQTGLTKDGNILLKIKTSTGGKIIFWSNLAKNVKKIDRIFQCIILIIR